jgi:hypothetical protein
VNRCSLFWWRQLWMRVGSLAFGGPGWSWAVVGPRSLSG